jgi:hypothetical protein
MVNFVSEDSFYKLEQRIIMRLEVANWDEKGSISTELIQIPSGRKQVAEQTPKISYERPDICTGRNEYILQTDTSLNW